MTVTLSSHDDGILVRVSGSMSYSQTIDKDILLRSLQELQAVKYAKPEPFSLDRLVSQAKERLRVSIEANAAYALKQFNEAGEDLWLEVRMRELDQSIRSVLDWRTSIRPEFKQMANRYFEEVRYGRSSSSQDWTGVSSSPPDRRSHRKVV